CPDADGKVEGTGIFNFFVDYTNAQATQTDTLHIELNVKAKYKGQVGDNALLEGPVNAEIDYSYVSSGRTRASNGALTNIAPTNIQQHITMPIMVSPKAMAPPDLGTSSGGDPTKGHYAEAAGTGLMLSYWAGVYYSIAQIKWYGGERVVLEVTRGRDFASMSRSILPVILCSHRLEPKQRLRRL